MKQEQPYRMPPRFATWLLTDLAVCDIGAPLRAISSKSFGWPVPRLVLAANRRCGQPSAPRLQSGMPGSRGHTSRFMP
jgi:hypothetical protein